MGAKGRHQTGGVRGGEDGAEDDESGARRCCCSRWARQNELYVLALVSPAALSHMRLDESRGSEAPAVVVVVAVDEGR